RLVDIIRKHSGNAARYMTADETMAHPQTAALGIVRDIKTSDGSTAQVRAFPVRFSRMRPELHATAPKLGEHSKNVAGEAGLDPAAISRLIETGGLHVPAQEK
ncbi:MAG: CoA transferase, partial [Burkholderiales bacterium]